MQGLSWWAVRWRGRSMPLAPIHLARETRVDFIWIRTADMSPSVHTHMHAHTSTHTCAHTELENLGTRGLYQLAICMLGFNWHPENGENIPARKKEHDKIYMGVVILTLHVLVSSLDLSPSPLSMVPHYPIIPPAALTEAGIVFNVLVFIGILNNPFRTVSSKTSETIPALRASSFLSWFPHSPRL